jgi:hypothetical protein
MPVVGGENDFHAEWMLCRQPNDYCGAEEGVSAMME